MSEPVTDRLKELAVLYVVEELSGKELTDFERILSEDDALTSYIDELRTTLGDAASLPFREPSEAFLKGQRNILRGRIHLISKEPFLARVGDSIRRRLSAVADSLSAPKRPVLAAIGYVVVGLLIGRFLLTWPITMGDFLPSTFADEQRLLKAMEMGQLKAERMQFVQNGTERLVFHLKDDDEFTYTASPQDDITRDLLGYIALNEPNPGKRLKSIKLATSLTADEKVKMILVSALLDDDNTGIRLRAIKSLTDYPDDNTIWKAAMKALLEDDNTAVRIEALSLLARNPRESLIPVLQVVSRLDENEFIRDEAEAVLVELLAAGETEGVEE